MYDIAVTPCIEPADDVVFGVYEKDPLPVSG